MNSTDSIVVQHHRGGSHAMEEKRGGVDDSQKLNIAVFSLVESLSASHFGALRQTDTE